MIVRPFQLEPALASTVFGNTWGWDDSYWTQMDDIGPAPYQISQLNLNGALEVTVSAQSRDATGERHAPNYPVNLQEDQMGKVRAGGLCSETCIGFSHRKGRPVAAY
jgi:hypothetical protein